MKPVEFLGQWIAAAVVLCLLEWFATGGLLAPLMTYAVLWRFVKKLAAIVKRQGAIAKQRAVALGLTMLLMIGVLEITMLGNNSARDRLQNVVDACGRYKAKYQKFPDTLEALVPEFLSRIPPAKAALLMSQFLYYVPSSIQHSLTYVALPPFGYCIYDLEASQLKCLD